MFRGGIELSYRREPHKQLVTFNGHPANRHSPEAIISVEPISDKATHLELYAFYGRRGFYQVKWWVMVPFSEDITVDGESVDVYTNAAKDEFGLEYGRNWTRVKLYTVKPGMKVKVGSYIFTIGNNDLKNLMIYRRLDNSLVELEWIWWNEDRCGPIPRRWFFCNATMEAEGGLLHSAAEQWNEGWEPVRRLFRRVLGSG